jgi:tRNA uridine 5-carboxymethylaminomethyl modification enzyme
MKLDVIVVGAGHAGVEAARAAAKMGCSVGLCTLARETVALMPCNPAIGGTAKGHLVREIDALGGLMGLAIDATGLQFKLLNRSRGPAVWSPRAQADKAEYGRWVRAALEQEARITWIVGRASRILVEGARVCGLALEDGGEIECQALVVTTGTFLNGLIHVGRERRPAGRAGEPPSVDLAASLKSFGFEWGRLKTGTPPRLARRTIDFDRGLSIGAFHVERGDEEPVPLSFLTRTRPTNRVNCYLLHTTSRVHEMVRGHIAESPLFNGQITGIGPRYCPSLEDKVMRFPQRERHQLFLEPEGVESEEIYVNGLSMSLPTELQRDIVRALPGLEHADVIRPGYAVEYDFVQPTELTRGLETRRLPGLFLAGQINGTSGYEEAAAQGLMAGINAARRVQRRPPVVLERNEAYIGILIDDLVTKGCLEPYRMFTSRAEHRLLLRIDNADLRLTPTGREIGLVDEVRWRQYRARARRYEQNRLRLEQTFVPTVEGQSVSASRALRRPGVTLATLGAQSALGLELGPGLEEDLDRLSLETTVKYAGYLTRQLQIVERSRRQEHQRIPEDFPYERVPGLSRELIQRFSQIRPETLGQALRIPGATPAAVAVVSAFLRRMPVVDNGIGTAG